ncbi:NADPH-dependent ferric siderophore reductase [Microbacterium sp. SORGH_AS 1204]|uniref:siderophore-interacting protein n=1 Tax=Microbacterium sp. SORGH_AS_1204 TaxID=3041785 RepID=UPI00278CDC94|nr:siderophore-interacting protein [Microbacterium sp. SORGH_AS_1204]MDQ1136578.1 NADPH-dependent ferric siderophore reductase [Microbacterium sp. SORGH_AS_1204]
MSRELRLTQTQREVIAHTAHAHGLVDEMALVREAVKVSSLVTRVTIDLGGEPEAAEWAKPNTAIRIEVPALDDDTALVSRVYTVRRFEAPRTIEVDVVRHGHRTPMTAWLSGIRPGDRVRVIGPRTHLLPPHDGRPIELVADDSALPAVASILAAWPDGSRGRVRSPSLDEVVLSQLPAVPGVTVERITAVADVTAPIDSVLWAAGERDDMRALRARCIAAGMDKADLRVFGYWKRGVSNSVIDAKRLDHFAALLTSTGSADGADDFDVDI